MKKYIIIGIAITACITLYAAVWLWSAENGKVSAEPVKAAVIAEIEAKPEETPRIIHSVDNRAPEPELVAESDPVKPEEITAERKKSQRRPLHQHRNQRHPRNPHLTPNRGQ